MTQHEMLDAIAFELMALNVAVETIHGYMLDVGDKSILDMEPDAACEQIRQGLYAKVKKEIDAKAEMI